MMELTDDQHEFISSDGHCLVVGGPGSGKTTVAIFKGQRLVESCLKEEQRVLFLSFARPTIARVIEAIKQEHRLPKLIRSRIEVDTYHSIFWRILNAHGYLIGLPRRLNVLTPSNEAILLSAIRDEFGPDKRLSDDDRDAKQRAINEERLKSAHEKGDVCFDLFAPLVGELLSRSKKLRRLVGSRYPAIIVDEFQDTDDDQWNVIKSLGEMTRIIALADPEQRIYEWKGAHPERLTHFREKFSPKEFDFGNNNYRSPNTDIGLFGDHVLAQNFDREEYNGVCVVGYPPNESQAYTSLVTQIYAARARLAGSGVNGWTVAIIVPTKKMTRLISDVLRNPPGGLTPIDHRAVLDMEAITLAAEVLSFCMQASSSGNANISEFIALVCAYFEGNGGDSPTKADLKEAANIAAQYGKFENSGKLNARSILVPMFELWKKVRELRLSGNPDTDWVTVRDMMEHLECKRMQRIGAETRNVRLLERGEHLRNALAQDWRDNGRYTNALSIVRQAFLQEHFSTASRPESGVVVMNMHKVKGKQFDESILFEAWPRTSKGVIVANYGRFVFGNDMENADNGARYNLRVSITRGKKRTTILTPSNDSCILLSNI